EFAPGEFAPARSREPEEVATVEAQASLHGGALGQNAEQGEHGHRLAAPALPGEAEHLAAVDPVVDPVHDGHGPGGRRQPHAQSVDLEQAHWISCCRKPVRGSNTSRRLSPRKLNASTTVKIARPGNVPIHHHWKYWVPSATIWPHSACGGCAPRPRNDRPESRRHTGARASG